MGADCSCCGKAENDQFLCSPVGCWEGEAHWFCNCITCPCVCPLQSCAIYCFPCFGECCTSSWCATSLSSLLRYRNLVQQMLAHLYQSVQMLLSDLLLLPVHRRGTIIMPFLNAPHSSCQDFTGDDAIGDGKYGSTPAGAIEWAVAFGPH